MRVIRPLQPSHRDYEIIERIESALLTEGGGLNKLREEIPALIRQAIDEVIDTPRTGRVHSRELEKTEKTYIGTKVEILVRNFFHLPKGILDLKIDGLDVDVKSTIGNTKWMIPPEAVGKPCILVASDEVKRTCSFGILVAHLENLTAGANQDKKRSVSARGSGSIHWILADEPYPPSLWSQIGEEKTHAIMRGHSGNERVETLFREVQRRPIHRDTIQAVAQQKDYMKRLRKNGGARDRLAEEGIAILSRKYGAELIELLKLGPVGRDEFISIRPASDEERLLLRRAGKIH
jgi:hypothetical protein